jgi:hypothetical protein
MTAGNHLQSPDTSFHIAMTASTAEHDQSPESDKRIKVGIEKKLQKRMKSAPTQMYD